jgi:hypothetical protein
MPGCYEIMDWNVPNEADNQGRDLLKEMASQLEQQIASAKTRRAAAARENPAA